MALLAAETSGREVAVVWDSTTLLVKHVEDQATVEEGEALERVLRAEAKNVLRWPMLMRVPKASSRSSPSSRTSLRWRVRPGRCLTESTEHNLRSSPFCRPGALSCAIPSSVHHGRGITCPRGCGLLNSTKLKWPENLPHFKWWCLLPRSHCLGACLAAPFMWR
jgi:hypothetical protein